MRRHPSGFTLVELLAVVLVILVIAGITMGAIGYVQRQVGRSTVKAQFAALEAALESYKSDWGFYPATTPIRISATGFGESSNNLILYRALCGSSGKRYLSFSANQLNLDMGTKLTGGGLTNICDPWGTPYNYYCLPTATYGVSNAYPANLTNVYWYGGYTVGGQVNVRAYDLISYGPDKSTFVPGAIAYGGGYNYAWYYGVAGDRWITTNKTVDDITNFGR